MSSLPGLSSPKFCYSVDSRRNLGEKQTALEKAPGAHTKGKAEPTFSYQLGRRVSAAKRDGRASGEAPGPC